MMSKRKLYQTICSTNEDEMDSRKNRICLIDCLYKSNFLEKRLQQIHLRYFEFGLSTEEFKYNDTFLFNKRLLLY